MRPTFIVSTIVLFVLNLSNLLYSQSEMIAEIRNDISTDFGVYHPYIVTISPDAHPYTVFPDLSNVSNRNDFILDSEEIERLGRDYFFVTPHRRGVETAYNEMYDIYNECREQGIPIFVTTDAMLHTFHLCFDFILRTIEQKQFIADLTSILDALIAETDAQHSLTSESDVRDALETNVQFLYVARSLLDSTYIPPSPSAVYFQELKLIHTAAEFTTSPLFQYEEDYTQYIPRGHYTKSDSLRHYFLAMMWLGRMTFASDDRLPELSRKMTLSALLLVQAMCKSRVGVESGMDIWNRIYDPTVFFVGKSDDINFDQYLDIAYQIFGSDFRNLIPDVLADPVRFDHFMAMCYELPGPMITYPGQPKGFRFMGQRFTPDSWILDELVFNKVACMRIMPKGLDVMTVLGSQMADQLLTETGEKSLYPEYAVKLDSLKTVFSAYADSVWVQNVYWNWLYSLMPLLYPKEKGYPPFMRNTSWTHKELFAALGSWSELRHDTILYVKQSGTERGNPQSSNLIQGYVEPNPHLYGRLASLAGYLTEGLSVHRLLFPAFERHLLELKNLLLSLKAISEKELTNRPLTAEDYSLICDIGKTIETIVEFSEYESEGPVRGDEIKMPVVADVHTDSNSMTCLEEGVGYPFSIYVICRIEGELLITRGAGFSQYEFIQPIDQRLTDEAWIRMLTDGVAPPLADWTNSFIISDPTGSNMNPASYYWVKRGLSRLYCQLDSPAEIGKPFTISIITDPVLAGQTVHGELFSPTDTITPFDLVTDARGQANVTLTPLMVGDHYFQVTANALKYRSGFTVTRTTDGGEMKPENIPISFSLRQNYPNPFNASTTIAYAIPRAAHVNLTIYNMLGEQVKVLLDEEVNAGEYDINWNGKNDLGKAVSSGVYFYKITAADFSRMKKLVLMY